jgi:hypothetical protein
MEGLVLLTPRSEQLKKPNLSVDEDNKLNGINKRYF